MKKVRTTDPQSAEKMNLSLKSADLLQVLILKTGGEAKLMVKSVANQDGIRAWQKLYGHCHRKTFAKAIRDHREILYPRPLKLMSEVMTAVM